MLGSVTMQENLKEKKKSVRRRKGKERFKLLMKQTLLFFVHMIGIRELSVANV